MAPTICNLLTDELYELMLGGSPDEEGAAMGENCLTLNVWTPAPGPMAKLPVMVWFHGGGFFVEMPGLWWNDGGPLARAEEVVVVTVRHRIGALGYLDLASLGADDLPDAGNVGNLDLVAALEWVRDNIAGFGGDPGNVTVFGQSGGGAKVSSLLAMPAARGLIHKAIIQSGPGLRATERPFTAERALAVVEATGASKERLAEFRKAPASKIVAALSQVGMKVRGGPMIDGHNLPAHPFDPVAPAWSADIPVMIGTTRHEASIMLSRIPGVFDLDWDGFGPVAANVFGDQASRAVRTSTATPAAKPRPPKSSS